MSNDTTQFLFILAIMAVGFIVVLSKLNPAHPWNRPLMGLLPIMVLVAVGVGLLLLFSKEDYY